ncbi:MAG TPA: hypothetical protein VFN71_02710 [Methylomirabilota bacterium]|nr:hypothetical protein [Methylomirabilota bacterium]
MDAETRAYLDEALTAMRRDFAGLRGEIMGLGGEVSGLGGEVRGLRGEVSGLGREVTVLGRDVHGLRGELGDVRGELGDLRAEVSEIAVETRRHFDVTAEALRHDIQIVVEGVVTANAAIERLGTELRAEMDSRFAAVRVAFVEVRRDIDDLRGRL